MISFNVHFISVTGTNKFNKLHSPPTSWRNWHSFCHPIQWNIYNCRISNLNTKLPLQWKHRMAAFLLRKWVKGFGFSQCACMGTGWCVCVRGRHGNGLPDLTQNNFIHTLTLCNKIILPARKKRIKSVPDHNHPHHHPCHHHLHRERKKYLFFISNLNGHKRY